MLKLDSSQDAPKHAIKSSQHFRCDEQTGGDR